jgi:hypothetical protein
MRLQSWMQLRVASKRGLNQFAPTAKDLLNHISHA